MARSATSTSWPSISVVPVQEETARRRASPWAKDLRFSMEVAAVSTRKRNFIPEMLAQSTGSWSQVSSGISSEWARERQQANSNNERNRIRSGNMGPPTTDPVWHKNERSCYYIGEVTLFSYDGFPGGEAAAPRAQGRTQAGEHSSRGRKPGLSGGFGRPDHRPPGRRVEDEQKRPVCPLRLQGRVATGHRGSS